MRKIRKQETVVSTKVLVVLRLSIDLCESPSQPSHLSTRLPALIMQMTLVTKKVKVKNVLKSKRTTVQITAAAKRWFFSIDLLYCFWCPNESRLIRHYNSVSNLKVFFFFLEFKRKETNPEIKKNNQSRYNRFLRNCYRRLRSCLSVSDAMEKDYIIFSQDGRRTKSRKTSE